MQERQEKYEVKYTQQKSSPGDRIKMERTITDRTAEMTRRAMQIPRQFLFSADEITIS